MTEYARRDARALEPYYYRHVSAMTRERLDAKSDIAAELAWRDKMIDELTARAVYLSSAVSSMHETLEGIAKADWRKWEELATPEEFERWAKARANHALKDTLPEPVKDTRLLNWLEDQEGVQVAQRRPPLDDAYYWIVEFPEREREDGERGLNLRGALAAAMERWPLEDEK